MKLPQPNADDIRATYRSLAHQRHGVSEVRAIHRGRGVVGIGFLNDEDAFVKECLRTNEDANSYVGIQSRPQHFLERAPNVIRPFMSGAGNDDIEIVMNTVIDLDPVRPKDTASTDEELANAVAAAEAAIAWCKGEGLVSPRLMMSGNGAQLWFAFPPINLTAENRATVKANLREFEARIRERFGSKTVKVDSIHDFARIIKVIGSVSHKGDATPDRPHRTSVSLLGFERVEDVELGRRLCSPTVRQSERADTAHKLPVFEAPIREHAERARRDADGNYDWKSPVEMCSPAQRLWEQGCDDRSLAIFNMVRFFIHKGLPLSEIIDLVLEYDRRGLGKLEGRDGPAYIKQCYDKIAGSPSADGSIAPPCHSLQKLGYCPVNREPNARCEIYDHVFDIEKAVNGIPKDAPPQDLEYRLRPVLDAIAHRDPSVHGRYADLLASRFGLNRADVRRSIARMLKRRHERNPDESQNDSDDKVRSIDGEIVEDANCYSTTTTHGATRYISSFAITPLMRVETESSQIIIGNAHTDKGEIVRDVKLPLAAFQSKRDLIRHLRSADLQWTGSDNNTQGLLRKLSQYATPTRPGSSVLGDFKRGEHHLWLCPRGAITKDGFVESSPIIYVPSGASLDARVHFPVTDDATFQPVARTVFEFLPQLNVPKVILPILGWFFAAPMKPRFMERVGSFPALFIWGTQGSGKSSLISDVFWPLSGIRDAEPYSATETEFALLKILTSTRSIPIFIDEYKPYDMNRYRLNTLHRYLRRLYRGETEERGRPDQTVNTYHLQAPLCIAGETRPTEAALLERLVASNPAKATLEESEQYRLAFRELKAVELPFFATRYIQFCLGRDFDADLTVARNVAATLLAGRKVPIRVGQNITSMILGVHLFEEFAQACGYKNLPAELGMREAVDGVLADVMETEFGVKNALDHFIEMLGVMTIQREILHRTHYVVKDGILFIHLESAYDSFREHCRRIDYEGEIVDLKALRRLLHENRRQGGYVAVEGERVYFSGTTNRRRAFGIDPSKTDLVDLDNFPENVSSGYGSGTGFSQAWPG